MSIFPRGLVVAYACPSCGSTPREACRQVDPKSGLNRPVPAHPARIDILVTRLQQAVLLCEITSSGFPLLNLQKGVRFYASLRRLGEGSGVLYLGHEDGTYEDEMRIDFRDLRVIRVVAHGPWTALPNDPF